MASNDKMDRGLDEIIAETRTTNGPRGRRGGGGGGGGRRRERQDGPRDGVRKSYRDEPRNLDSEWVHDRDTRGTKIRVDNIHYDLTEDDLDELFRRIGPVTRLQLRYDRAGRSEGTAYVTYELKEDATEAIRQFDGANANGQPIRLTLLPARGERSRNPFDNAVMPGRPLSERITAPGGRARSQSPSSKYTQEDAVRKGIDRYIPGQGGRSRTPPPSRRRGGGGGAGGGRRPGARRERGERGEQDSNRGGRGNPRGKKTQEELDAEMEDYFGGGGAADGANGNAAPAATGGDEQGTGAAPAAVDDIDMIE
ncbi:hypothetical protein ACO1O0_000921 [Amphichorda felina]